MVRNTLAPMVLPSPIDGVAAHDRGAGVDRHAVFDGRMAFLSAQCLPRGQRLRHQTDALIHLHVVADDGGLAHDRAGAVIHEEVRADLRARMQVHAGAGVRPLGHDARNERDVVEIEFVRQPLHGDGFDERIRDDDFLLARRGGVAVEGRLGVGLQQFANARQAAQELQRQRARQVAQFCFLASSGAAYSRLLRISFSKRPSTLARSAVLTASISDE